MFWVRKRDNSLSRFFNFLRSQTLRLIEKKSDDHHFRELHISMSTS